MISEEAQYQLKLLHTVFRMVFNGIVYYLKLSVLVSLTATVSILSIPILLLRPCNPVNYSFLARFLVLFTRLVGIRYEIRGHDKVKHIGSAIFVANHQVGLDFLSFGPVVLVDGSSPMTLVMKKEVWYLGPFGIIGWLCGSITVDRTNTELAKQQLNSSMEKIKRRKCRLLVFPEGRRNDSGDFSQLLPLKKGAFHMAINGRLPIVPAVLSPYTFLDTESKYFGRGTVVMSILDPISTEGMTKEDIPDLIERTKGRIEEEYKRLRKELAGKGT